MCNVTISQLEFSFCDDNTGCFVSGLGAKMCPCLQRGQRKIHDAKCDRMSNLTTAGNSGEPWMHLVFI